MEAGEVLSVETVVVLEPAESRRAGRQVGPCLGLHCFCSNIINMHILACRGRFLTFLIRSFLYDSVFRAIAEGEKGVNF